jgi:glycosyltransferase involved in cell wall biosynthesis
VFSEPAPSGERRIRVAVVPEQFPQGPDDVAGIFVRDYIEAIRPHCDVTVVLPGNEEQPGTARRASAEDGVEYVICTPALRGRGVQRQRLARLEGLFRIGRVAALLRNVDVIHAHGAIFHGVAAARLGNQLRIPVVLTIHTGPFEKLLQRRTTRLLARRTLERVDCVCPVSDDLRRQIEHAGIRAKRLQVTYNPVDTDLFRPSSTRRLPHRRIAFAGRLEEYKGGLRVARAFASIAERLPGWGLTIAGDGPERPAIKAFVDASSALNGRVELPGSYSKVQFADLLARSDFFVYPSRHESFGLVIAEAMSAGLPVIAPDCTAPPEYVDHRSGVLVPPDDVTAIADAIEHMAFHLSRFDSNAIRQTIVERFGFDAFGRRILELYGRLILSRDPHGARSCAG